MYSNTRVEEVEKTILDETETYVQEGIKNLFSSQTNEFCKEELVNNLAGQGEGRARWPEYSIKHLIDNYGDLEGEEAKELGMRLASLEAFGEGLERVTSVIFLKYLLDKDVEFQPWISPNASDSAFLVDNLIEDVNVLLHIDAKTITGFQNLNDSQNEGIVSKHQLKWNQTSYRPALLRERSSNAGGYQKRKYKVLDNIQNIGGKDYLTVTLFLCNLSYVGEENKPEVEKGKVKGEILSSVTYLGVVPNGILQSDYYDSFFHKGKSGYDDESDIPKDARISYIKNKKPMKFENLDKGSRCRLIYPEVKNKSKTIKALRRGNNKQLDAKELEVIDFEEFQKTKQEEISMTQ